MIALDFGQSVTSRTKIKVIWLLYLVTLTLLAYYRNLFIIETNIGQISKLQKFKFKSRDNYVNACNKVV